jgi:hypothetical protein
VILNQSLSSAAHSRKRFAPDTQPLRGSNPCHPAHPQIHIFLVQPDLRRMQTKESGPPAASATGDHAASPIDRRLFPIHQAGRGIRRHNDGRKYELAGDNRPYATTGCRCRRRSHPPVETPSSSAADVVGHTSTSRSQRVQLVGCPDHSDPPSVDAGRDAKAHDRAPVRLGRRGDLMLHHLQDGRLIRRRRHGGARVGQAPFPAQGSTSSVQGSLARTHARPCGGRRGGGRRGEFECLA